MNRIVLENRDQLQHYLDSTYQTRQEDKKGLINETLIFENVLKTRLGNWLRDNPDEMLEYLQRNVFKDEKLIGIRMEEEDG